MRFEDCVRVEYGEGIIVLRKPHEDDPVMTPDEAELESHSRTDPIRSELKWAGSEERKWLA